MKKEKEECEDECSWEVIDIMNQDVIICKCENCDIKAIFHLNKYVD